VRQAAGARRHGLSPSGVTSRCALAYPRVRGLTSDATFHSRGNLRALRPWGGYGRARALEVGRSRAPPLQSGKAEPSPSGSGEAEPSPQRSGKTWSTSSGSGEAARAPCLGLILGHRCSFIRRAVRGRMIAWLGRAA
jgi:hypothetical protein